MTLLWGLWLSLLVSVALSPCIVNALLLARLPMSMAKPSSPLPRSIKESTTSLRLAVQAGLKAQCSRMEIQVPMATSYGVEVSNKAQIKGPDEQETSADGKIASSNREVARLLLEMFQPIGEAVTIAFATEDESKRATSVWAPGSYKGNIVTLGVKKGSKNPKRRGGGGGGGGGGGFAAKMQELESPAEEKRGPGGSTLVPKGTEVLVVVGPGEKELTLVQNDLDSLGMGCLVILLNARLDRVPDEAKREYFFKEFEPIFFLQPLGSGETEDFLYKAFPKDWTVARKPKLGPPKVLQSSEARFSQAEIEHVLKSEAAQGLFDNLF